MQFKDLSYKQKNKYLLICIGIFGLLIYTLNIKKTITEYKEYKKLNRQLEVLKDAPQLITQFQQKLVVLEQKIGNDRVQEWKRNNNLLEVVTDFCHQYNIRLREFPEPVVTYQNDYALMTNVFKVQGRFVNLLKLAYMIEQEYQKGKIVSLKFEKKKNRKTRRIVLEATIYLQNIKKK